MLGSWVLEVFWFDLPFDIHIQIISNWNLAENRVTEIDIYVQHLQLDVLVNKRSGGRKEHSISWNTQKKHADFKGESSSWVPHKVEFAFGSPHKNLHTADLLRSSKYPSNNTEDYFISLEVQLSSSGP